MTKSKCEPYKDKIIELISKDYGYRTIAKELGLDRNAIRKYCKKQLNYFSNAYELAVEPQNKDEISAKIFILNPDVEYIDGYKNNRSRINIRFKTCGHVTKRTYDLLIRRKVVCLECAEKEREIKRELELKERKIKEEVKEKQKLIRRFKNLIIKRIKKLEPKAERVCECCGKVYYSNYRNKYCSDKCGNRVSRKNKDVTRRLKIKNALVDKNITVKRLYERDNGICALCHEKTEIDDYIVLDNGAVVCGNHYPSIDHIKPLSKGGLHSWDNVQLAHRICNTRKGDIYD